MPERQFHLTDADLDSAEDRTAERLARLLKRWAEIEPQRCRLSPEGAPMVRHDAYGLITVVVETERAWQVERAVREAIAARGWSRGVDPWRTFDGPTVEVSTGIGLWAKGYDGTIEGEVCALLEAYLDALAAVEADG